MQCSSQIITTYKPTEHLDFYRTDAFPVAQPTVLKRWREMDISAIKIFNKLVRAENVVKLQLTKELSFYGTYEMFVQPYY